MAPPLRFPAAGGWTRGAMPARGAMGNRASHFSSAISLPPLAQPSLHAFYKTHLRRVPRQAGREPPHRLRRRSILQPTHRPHHLRQRLPPLPHRHVERPVPSPIAPVLRHLRPSLAPQFLRRRDDLRPPEPTRPFDLSHRRLCRVHRGSRASVPSTIPGQTPCRPTPPPPSPDPRALHAALSHRGLRVVP